MSRIDIYEKVTNRIIEKLEKGVVPWRLPWNQNGMYNLPVNWKTQKPYSGINLFLVEPGEYATFKQIKDAGGKVKKGAKSSFVVFWSTFTVEKEQDGEKVEEERWFMKYSNVFEINTQVEGLESKRKPMIVTEHDPIDHCEKIIRDFKERVGSPSFSEARTGAWYRPSDDLVNVPPLEDFKKAEGYYSTMFHEIGHSTGHPTRLNREGIADSSRFGSEKYSKEELVAELTAIMLCAEAGIENQVIDNSASYISSWLAKLKDDKKLIVSASQQANKAVKHIIGTKKENNKECA